MKIKTEVTGEFGSNCYMLSTERAAVVIDIGEFTVGVKQFLIDNKDKELMILATHRHFDHVAGISKAKLFSGARVGIHKLDECGLLSAADSLGANFDLVHTPLEADFTFEDGDEITVGDITLRVMHTPGHTEGSVCLIADDVIFSGDTLFYRSVGRTDFPTGNLDMLTRSLKRLYALPRDYRVLPGHDRETRLSDEKANNFYIRG